MIVILSEAKNLMRSFTTFRMTEKRIGKQKAIALETVR